MYSDLFCKVYNEFGWNYYPEIFGQQLIQWLEEKQLKPKTALDLACGTGVLCEILHRAGMQVTGMDFSAGMIEIARRGSDRICYEVADMITYRPEKQFELVTCTGDAINHIARLADVEQIFRNVHGYLADGGFFVFDILNEQEVSDSEPFEMDYDAHTRVWFQMTRPELKRVNLKIRVYENMEFRFEENIRETVYDPEEISKLLKNCGFSAVKWGNRLLENSNPGTTWFVVAQK